MRKLVFVLLAFTYANCLLTPDVVQVNELGTYYTDQQIFQSNEPLFYMSIPEDWEVEPGNKTNAKILSPFQNPQDNFRESLNIAFYELPRGASLNEFYLANTRKTGGLLKNADIKKEHQDEIAGQKAKSFEVEYDLREDIRLNAYFLLSVLPIDNKPHGMIITCTGTQDDFETYRPYFNNMIASFQTGTYTPPEN